MRKQKPENMVFAHNLKLFIDASGKEQKQICIDLKIPESSMSDYVNGKSLPRFRTIERIAQYFGAAVSDLIIEASNTQAAKRKIMQKVWYENFGDIVWTQEELNAFMDFARYLLSKRT